VVWYRYWAAEYAAPDGAATFHVEQGRTAFHVKHDADEHTPAFHVKPGDSGAAPDIRDEDPAGDRSGASSNAPAEPAAPRAQLTGGPRTVVIANQKGGVGKTTTAVSVAAALAQQGLAVLLVDLDPQSNASSGLSVRPDRGQVTTYEVLVNDVPAQEAVQRSDIDGLHVMPASIDLAGAEIELVSAFSREQKLQRALKGVRDDYDLIFVDCPPSLGLLTVNALAAGDGVLVPIQCEYYALEGLRSLEHNIDLIRQHLNPSLATLGYVMTMYDGRTRLSEQVVAEVRAHFGTAVFATRIPRSVRLAEAPSYGQPITVFDPGSRGAVAYHRVASELVDRLQSSPDTEGVVHP
jgi:chromosome partitioning protein